MRGDDATARRAELLGWVRNIDALASQLRGADETALLASSGRLVELVAQALAASRDGRARDGELGDALHAVGVGLEGVDNWGEAWPWYARAATEKADYGGADDDGIGESLHRAAACLAGERRLDEADAFFERAVERRRRRGGRRSGLAKSLFGRGDVVLDLGRAIDALALFEEAAALFTKPGGGAPVDHDAIARALLRVCDCLRLLGRAEALTATLDRARAEALIGDPDGHIDPLLVEAIDAAR